MVASIKDVAKEAGVSIATVSRVLNDVDVVNDDTKQKVVDAIKKLDYRPNIVARSLKTQRSKTIGIIIPDISSPFYPEVVRGAEDVANIYDYNIMLCNADLDTEKELDYIKVLKEKMCDGVLLMSSSLNKEALILTKNLNLKIVLVETKDESGEFPSVIIDDERAAFDIVSTLIKNGNKKVAFIGVSLEENNAKSLRYQGYKRALAENNIEYKEELVSFGGLKAKDGYKAMEKIIRNTDIDGVFTVSDELAMGAINSLRENNLRVPEDIDVAGFDDIYAAAQFYPKLTTVAVPMYDMGSVGMRMLIKSINNQELDPKHYVLPYQIIERNSCK